MKIAFVTRSLTGGGAERVVSVLANSLCEYKDVEEVYIIAIVEDTVSYDICDKIKYYANKSVVSGKIQRVRNRYSFLRKTLKTIEADIVISFCTQINIYSILAMQGLHGKLIISERNDPNRDPIQRYVRILRNIVYHFCKYAVFQTPDAADYFKKIITGPVKIIMNPIKRDLPKQYIGEREKRIVSVARLTNVKNHQMLIKAFSNVTKQYPEYILEIYGDGPEKEKLQALINSLGLEKKVYLRGFSENVHLETVAATCFVLASNYEGISNSMLEALGMGLPVICTDCPIGGARMAINNGVNGILIPVGGQTELEKAMIHIIEDKKFRDMLSNEAIKIRRYLAPECISEEWLKYIESIKQ